MSESLIRFSGKKTASYEKVTIDRKTYLYCLYLRDFEEARGTLSGVLTPFKIRC